MTYQELINSVKIDGKEILIHVPFDDSYEYMVEFYDKEITSLRFDTKKYMPHLGGWVITRRLKETK